MIPAPFIVRRSLAICLAVLLLAAACGKRPTEEVPLAGIDAAGFDRLLESHRGDVLLVDFWAMWCAPCVEMLPRTVELHNRFRDRGLVVVTVSLDDPAEEQSVRRVLERNGAKTENYLSRYGVGPEAFEAFSIAGGAIPHLRLYDRRGNLLKTFSGSDFDHEEVERAVEMQLDPGRDSD